MSRMDNEFYKREREFWRRQAEETWKDSPSLGGLLRAIFGKKDDIVISPMPMPDNPLGRRPIPLPEEESEPFLTVRNFRRLIAGTFIITGIGAVMVIAGLIIEGCNYVQDFVTPQPSKSYQRQINHFLRHTSELDVSRRRAASRELAGILAHGEDGQPRHANKMHVWGTKEQIYVQAAPPAKNGVMSAFLCVSNEKGIVSFTHSTLRRKNGEYQITYKDEFRLPSSKDTYSLMDVAQRMDDCPDLMGRMEKMYPKFPEFKVN